MAIMATTLFLRRLPAQRKLVNDAIASLTSRVKTCRGGYLSTPTSAKTCRCVELITDWCYSAPILVTCYRRLHSVDLPRRAVQSVFIGRLILRPTVFANQRGAISFDPVLLRATIRIVQWGWRIVCSALLTPLSVLAIGIFAVVTVFVIVAFTVIVIVGVTTTPASAAAAIAAPSTPQLPDDPCQRPPQEPQLPLEPPKLPKLPLLPCRRACATSAEARLMVRTATTSKTKLFVCVILNSSSNRNETTGTLPCFEKSLLHSVANKT